MITSYRAFERSDSEEDDSPSIESGREAEQKLFIVGIAYNMVIDSALPDGREAVDVKAADGRLPTPTGKETTDEEARRRLYTHDQVRLPRSMLKAGWHITGTSLMVEHGNLAEFGDARVGYVTDTRVVGKNLEISATVTNPSAIAMVNDGRLRHLSVGYTVDANRSFDLREVSLCNEPFFKGCDITVTASKLQGRTAVASPGTPAHQPRRPLPSLGLTACLAACRPLRAARRRSLPKIYQEHAYLGRGTRPRPIAELCTHTAVTQPAQAARAAPAAAA
jgi:hypothetical protein